MTFAGVVGFRRGELWRGIFITFSIYAYMRTFLRKCHNNPPQLLTHHRPAAWGFSFLRGAPDSRDLAFKAAPGLGRSPNGTT